MSANKIPLHLVTGFLGVGKTTTLLHILKMAPAQTRTAIIINEYGEISIDGPTISAEGQPFSMVEVPGGCICCAGMEMLLDQLGYLLDEVKPDRIVIEPSGIARPSDLLLKIRDSQYHSRFAYRPVIGIFDPVLVADADMRDSLIFDDQAESADLVFINRIDLAQEQDIHETRSIFAGYNPAKMQILEGSHGRIPSEWLEVTYPESYPIKQSNKETGHKISVKGQGWYWKEGVFSFKQLLDFFNRLNQERDIVRAKGIFLTDEGPVLLEVAGKSVHHRPSEYRIENRLEILSKAFQPLDFDRFYRLAEDCRVISVA